MLKQIFVAFFAMTAFCFQQPLMAVESGSQAPNCQLNSLKSENNYVLEQYKGKVIFLDFWASWCPPCAKSFTFLNEINHDLKDRGLEVLVVNLDENPEDAQAFLAKNIADFTVLADKTKRCAQDFNVEGMPSSYIIDRNGVIRHIHMGFRSEDAKELRMIVEKLLVDNLAAK